ncbi:LLM class flavin-dependent oxidoreductase [Streptomyces viridosporus]|uniref:LLM class flavin-dependent oxidoreductase n=1 Tax=Streptomyces viridosporus TaxID=67581 RepID=UPI0009C06707|nr:LLM class flavin-dependent oxidoreductase [Streptomyces viridosporus]
MKFNLMSLGDLVTDPVTGERSTNARRYKMFPEMAVLAESAGFNGINMGEHHGIEYIYSAPPVVLAAIAERTTTLRLGTAVTLLANLDGLRIAEDYATVDVLSDGRVDVVHGRGNFFASTYTLFGQSLDESAARFKENAELVDQLWTGEPLHWSGRFRPSINGESLQPAPIQAARDCMWIGGGSSLESVELAARLGWKLMLPSAFGDPSFFTKVVDHYLAKWEEFGHDWEPEIGAGWHVWVGADSKSARDQWEPRYAAYHAWMNELLAQINPAVPKQNQRPFNFDWLTTKGPAIVGSPDEVVDRISRLSEQLKVTTHLAYMDMGGMPEPELFNAIELFGSKVIPQLADA